MYEPLRAALGILHSWSIYPIEVIIELIILTMLYYFKIPKYAWKKLYTTIKYGTSVLVVQFLIFWAFMAFVKVGT